MNKKKTYQQYYLRLMLISLLFISAALPAHAQITLTHNVGTTPITNGMPTCEYQEYWAKTFTLDDFGITKADQFHINSAQVAVSNSYNGARLIFNFYSIDANFPNTAPQRISYGHLVLAPEIGDTPEIVQIDFSTPVVVPAGVERILVEVSQSDDIYNNDYKKVKIAGTEFDNDVSWFQGCRTYYAYIPTENLPAPIPNANFYINVTGEVEKVASYGSTTRLTHNVCDELIKTDIFGCSNGGMSWSREFILEDFGISLDEEFVINSGQIGLYYAAYGVDVKFNIYEIDDNFPTSFSETDLIGSSQVVPVPYIGSNTSSVPVVIDVEFETPIIIPSHVTKILVEVFQGGNTAFPAGTAQDNDVTWIRAYSGGCRPFGVFETATSLGYTNSRLYLNVTGNSTNTAIPFNMKISNICAEFLKEFSVTNTANIASVQWNFGDVASGAANASNDLSPTHDFSADGKYTVTATVTDLGGTSYDVVEQIDVVEPPEAYAISNIYACEDVAGTGISSGFNTANIESQVLGGQTDKVITYIDGEGNELELPLTAYLTNSIKDRETITVRVAHKDILCCISETTFDLIVQPLPQITAIDDVYACDNTNSGFSTFDLTALTAEIMGSQTGVSVTYFNQNGTLIPNANLSTYTNAVVNKENITARVTNTTTTCYSEITFDIAINEPPTANPLTPLIGCDDNSDGISEFFDTSGVEAEVLAGQTGLDVSYYNESGTAITLSNPYTNTIARNEVIRVRVTNPTTQCFAETNLILSTSAKPQITTPENVYACDIGNGFATFDLTYLSAEVIGNQTGLTVSYYDQSGDIINDSQLANYQNKIPYSETITITVENQLNSSCTSEVELLLGVNELPTIALEESYFLCDLEPFLAVSVPVGFVSYQWEFQDGSIVSTTQDAHLALEGSYTVFVEKLENGIRCLNAFSFDLVRSKLPTIDRVLTGDFGNNYIEIMVSGDGDLEYAIDGLNYQDSNRFDNLAGGNYIVTVRDKKGCGVDTRNISIIDYPRFFSPNNDGINDTWRLLGDINQNYKLSIFDRFGKLLKVLTPQDNSWDGLYNGRLLPQDTYWFNIKYEDGSVKKGYFALRLE